MMTGSLQKSTVLKKETGSFEVWKNTPISYSRRRLCLSYSEIISEQNNL